MVQLNRLLWAVSLVLAPVLADTTEVPNVADFSTSDVTDGDALSQLSQLAFNNSESVVVPARKTRRGVVGCSPANIRVRQEWRTLSKPQRRAYVAAVKCLRTKPSLLDPVAFPAAKSLYDDFVAIHLMQTMNIHLSGIFLTWHRYFTWAYEEKLRTQCGYTGSFPYWEWGLDVNNPAASPVFDGSDSSLGGNGEYIPHQGLILTEPFNPDAQIPLPPGSGGGCVKTGPFADWIVHVGPVALAQYGTTAAYSVPDPLNDHARCLKRDLNAGVAKRFTSFLNTTRLILQNNNVEQFQAVMQADPRYVHGELGVHGGGHFTMGGDPGSDPFISPGDPAFFLHHGQIDRIFWIWQMLDFPHRQSVFGTQTFLNFPPSPDVTLDDIIDISPLAAPVKVRDMMNTVGGKPFCYVYL
ncbi:hypothetical protein B0T25DRAFT_458687 [Lasiosphaeria hispida]|uniref:Tyrosinase copper-binding domain-containing protein n=1 Tax=Lasiosphaeria hispida TaxID=260671 RepID=A0AAJ0HDU8_9PEZI|nr:hypothetical protein B0T25DRAFT_458687 [Lasiosphaeria hispida]